MRTKAIIIIILFMTFALISCTPIPKVIPIKTVTPVAENFFFVFKDYCTTPLDVLDTKSGVLVHSPFEETTPVPFQLSNSETNDIFQKVMVIDFFSYPSNFVIPDGYANDTDIHASSYELSVTYGAQTNTVKWNIGYLNTTDYEKANQLWELLMLIKSIIHENSEYQKLPGANAICM